MTPYVIPKNSGLSYTAVNLYFTNNGDTSIKPCTVVNPIPDQVDAAGVVTVAGTDGSITLSTDVPLREGVNKIELKSANSTSLATDSVLVKPIARAFVKRIVSATVINLQ